MSAPILRGEYVPWLSLLISGARKIREWHALQQREEWLPTIYSRFGFHYSEGSSGFACKIVF